MEENNELKSDKVDVVTQYIKDEVESSINENEVDDSDGDDEQNKVIEFRSSMRDLVMEYLAVDNVHFCKKRF